MLDSAAQFLSRGILFTWILWVSWLRLAWSDVFDGGMFATPAVSSLQSTGALVCLPIAATEDGR